MSINICSIEWYRCIITESQSFENVLRIQNLIEYSESYGQECVDVFGIDCVDIRYRFIVLFELLMPSVDNVVMYSIWGYGCKALSLGVFQVTGLLRIANPRKYS